MLIENDGPAIRATDYWQSEHAAAGMCYLSGNAGALRLLVPPVTAAQHLADMRTGKRVTIEPSIAGGPQCVDIVFEDGSDSPFYLALDRRQMDRALTPGRRVPFAVWVQGADGGTEKVLSLQADIKP